MIEVTSHIGILYVSLFIPHAQSLKEKRMVLRSLKAQIRNHFNASVGEFDGQDKWQVSVLGFSIIGRDKRYVEGDLQKILSFVERFHGAEVSEHATEFC